MKRASICLFALLFSASAAADSSTPLAFQETLDPAHLAFSLNAGAIPKLDSRPPDVTAVPDNLSSRAFWYLLPLGKNSFFAAADPSSGKLFVDTNHDLSLADEDPLSYTRVSTPGLLGSTVAFLFGPAALAVPDSKAPATANVRFLLHSGGELQVFPAGFYTATLDVDSRPLSVALVDTDYDGRLAGAFDGSDAFDTVVVDLDRDGTIASPASAPGEVLPLPKLLRVDDAFYLLSVAPDASSISISPADPPMGALAVDFPSADVLLWSDSGVHHLTGPDSSWPLPAGVYRAVRLALLETKGLDVWTLPADGTGDLAPFTISSGETTSLSFGAPLVAKAVLRLHKRTIYVEHSLTGPAGETYFPSASHNGALAAPPAVTIVDDAGNVLESGAFKYG